MITLYVMVSVIIVSLVSLFAAIPLLIKKKASKTTLLTLLSLSVGALLGSVFIHFMPEILHEGYSLAVGSTILVGFFFFFVIEKFIHHKHKHGLQEGHGHAYQLAPINLIGDGIHNFIDGLMIAGGYLA